jgi:hypothetical protein
MRAGKRRNKLTIIGRPLAYSMIALGETFKARESCDKTKNRALSGCIVSLEAL